MAQLSCGIIGLPNTGKSTLFNALTRGHAEVAPYPFCTINPNVGAVAVPDPRLDRVAALAGVGRIVYHHVEYVDVAGLVRDASKGAGRGNQFLDHVRNCQALLQVVRCFENQNVAHVSGRLDPADDIRTVNLELILADLQTVDHALQRLSKKVRSEADAHAAVEVLEKLRQHLNEERPARTLHASPAEKPLVDSFHLLTAKSMLYVANVGEADLPAADTERVRTVTAFAASEGSAAIPLCAEFEEEVAALDPAEAGPFLEAAGLHEPGLQRTVHATSRLLGLVSFFTFNESEARAWTVPRGATAQEAAGVIHTDFAKHFIRAEVTAFRDFEAAGGAKGAHDKGLMRIEGREYHVQDGDVIYFRVGV